MRATSGPPESLPCSADPHPATVSKIINEILGPSPNITFARDTRDLLIDCCVEFITLISSEANDIAEKESKKTIAIEHIEKALRELGFPEYVKEVLAAAGEQKEEIKVRQPRPSAASDGRADSVVAGNAREED